MSRDFCYEQHLWDGNKQVLDRFDEGKRTVNDMVKFLDTRATIEAEMAKKLQALCAKPAGTTEKGTLGAGWLSSRQNAEEQSASRATLAQCFKELSADLANYKKEITRQKDQHVISINNLNRDLEKGKTAVNRAKTLYHQKTQSAETSLIAYEKAQQDPTFTAKKLSSLNTVATKQRKEAEAADQSYQAQLQDHQSFQVKYEESMKEILKDFEAIEVRRVTKLKDAIDIIVKAQETLLQELNQQQANLKEAVSKINGIEDVQHFISENNTRTSPPKPTEYEPYKGKHEQFKKKSIPKVVAVSQPNVAEPAATGKAAAGPTTRGSGAADAKKAANPKAKALYDYVAADATELSFSIGDIITVTKQDGSGWWEGENNGKHGMFPGNYVEVITAAAADTRKRCQAKFEFNAQSSDELTIKVGDIVFIDSEASGWFSGTNEKGESGLFPANYVEVL